MKHTININIEEIASFKATDEKQELIDNILDSMSEYDYKQTIKKNWKDMLEAEEEFDNRKHIIVALKVLIAGY